jgi:hypothetical protein
MNISALISSTASARVLASIAKIRGADQRASRNSQAGSDEVPQMTSTEGIT